MNLSRPSLFALFLAVATIFAFLISSLQAGTTEQHAVLAPVMALFDGMAKRDPEAMKATLLPGGTMVLMRDGKPTQMTFEAFV
ncbi:MAG TPA: nuclear transport factor 2 family protein, partial [Terriglobales bacterium]|nr:nuclear transport factor 2 family protein [Terriglobales bacterium]